MYKYIFIIFIVFSLTSTVWAQQKSSADELRLFLKGQYTQQTVKELIKRNLESDQENVPLLEALSDKFDAMLAPYVKTQTLMQAKMFLYTYIATTLMQNRPFSDFLLRESRDCMPYEEALAYTKCLLMVVETHKVLEESESLRLTKED